MHMLEFACCVFVVFFGALIKLVLILLFLVSKHKQKPNERQKQNCKREIRLWHVKEERKTKTCFILNDVEWSVSFVDFRNQTGSLTIVPMVIISVYVKLLTKLICAHIALTQSFDVFYILWANHLSLLPLVHLGCIIIRSRLSFLLVLLRFFDCNCNLIKIIISFRCFFIGCKSIYLVEIVLCMLPITSAQRIVWTMDRHIKKFTLKLHVLLQYY